MATKPRKPRGPNYDHNFPHRGVLPEGHYYTLTWTVPPEFGGMTTVVLERSTAFARQDRRRVEILTLSPALRDGKREAELRSDGRISRAVRLRNLWNDLLKWPDRKLTSLDSRQHDMGVVSSEILPRTTTSWAETRKDDSGKVLQTDRYRSNGTLLVSDRQDVRERGRQGGRRITLFDHRGTPIGQWSTARAFYYSWLDSVFRGRRTFLISDSSFVGGMLHDYRRDNVILCQVIHNHFLKDPTADLDGELAPAKFEILSHLDSYDLVTTLTEQQRNDMYSVNLATNNLRTISNSTHEVGGQIDTARNQRHGVMIARLAHQKRVEDAVHAISRVSADEPDVLLDIYGEGGGREGLLTLRAELDAAELVRFHGHVPTAKDAFKTASFSVLTSRFEGQGLAILESMSAGCIPIAYDIPYGPSDIIDDGDNGFLVRAGDVEALASTIVSAMRMSRGRLREMRKSALNRAADFFEGPIVRRWGEALDQLSFDPIANLGRHRAELILADSTGPAVHMSIRISDEGAERQCQCYAVWKSRSGHRFGRCPGTVEDGVLSVSIPPERFAGLTPGLIDFYVDVVGMRGFKRIRITAFEENVANGLSQLTIYPTAHSNLSARILAP